VLLVSCLLKDEEKESFERLKNHQKITHILNRKPGFKIRQLHLAGTFNCAAVILKIYLCDHVIRLQKKEFMFTSKKDTLNHPMSFTYQINKEFLKY
jgi:hypothetical protein